MACPDLSFAAFLPAQAEQGLIIGHHRIAPAHHADQLSRLATKSDVLVIAAPHTSDTARMVDDVVMRALPGGSFVVNLARGSLLDETALLRHLDEGHLGGAVLDVLATEPLSPRHPFWRHERVLVTPHVGGVSDGFGRERQR